MGRGILIKPAGVLLENIGEWLEYSRLGRNDKCLCGSGKKYKKCCIDFDWTKDIKNRENK